MCATIPSRVSRLLRAAPAALLLAGLAAAPAHADFFDGARKTFTHDMPKFFEHDVPHFFTHDVPHAFGAGGGGHGPAQKAPEHASPAGQAEPGRRT